MSIADRPPSDRSVTVISCSSDVKGEEPLPVNSGHVNGSENAGSKEGIVGKGLADGFSSLARRVNWNRHPKTTIAAGLLAAVGCTAGAVVLAIGAVTLAPVAVPALIAGSVIGGVVALFGCVALRHSASKSDVETVVDTLAERWNSAGSESISIQNARNEIRSVLNACISSYSDDDAVIYNPDAVKNAKLAVLEAYEVAEIAAHEAVDRAPDKKTELTTKELTLLPELKDLAELLVQYTVARVIDAKGIRGLASGIRSGKFGNDLSNFVTQFASYAWLAANNIIDPVEEIWKTQESIHSAFLREKGRKGDILLFR